MKKILLIGAGRSTSTLIRYLLDNADLHDWQIIVADINLQLARDKIKNHPKAKPHVLDITDIESTGKLIESSDIVISMLPANMHLGIAEMCIYYKKHMVTASYISDKLKQLDGMAKKNNVLLLNETGVDPGIDHMSAMKVIDKIHEKGGIITEFESNTGGLVAPKYDNNPWNYKITWNPRNVVLAGKNGAQFLHNGRYKYIPYHKIFKRYERIHVLDLGEFEAYPNRDSLKYRNTYGLNDVQTMFRGTIRRPGFCKAWNILVELGITSDDFVFHDSHLFTYRDFINSFLAYSKDDSVEEKLARYLGIDEDSIMMYKLRWLGIFDRKKIHLENSTPAKILQQILEEKLILDKDDKDMIVMQHQFIYEINGKKMKTLSSMVSYANDDIHTAMARAVGLPVAIIAKNILSGNIKSTGVHIPTIKEIYATVLKELEGHDIQFIEEHTNL